MKIKSIFYIIAFLILKIASHAQNFQYTKIQLGFEKKQVSISSICYKDGIFYLPSENCGSIFLIDKAGHSIGTRLIKTMANDFEIEGITVFKGSFFAVSEVAPTVFRINMSNSTLNKIQLPIILPSKTGDGGDGVEGIAANEKQNKLYLLLERKTEQARTYAVVYTFEIQMTEAGDSIELFEGRTDTILLESKSWRYSDIYFDNTASVLYLLKSKKGAYAIETIKADSNGYIIPTTRQVLITDALTTEANRWSGPDFNYSNNLEGLTMDNEGNLYIVSDNCVGKPTCREEDKAKTLFIKVSKH
jgi:uncharacterized protein YjiK